MTSSRRALVKELWSCCTHSLRSDKGGRTGRRQLLLCLNYCWRSLAPGFMKLASSPINQMGIANQ
jgi:hypothetical protein